MDIGRIYLREKGVVLNTSLHDHIQNYNREADQFGVVERNKDAEKKQENTERNNIPE